MAKEIEVKFLDIVVSEIEDKLQKIGANKVGEIFYRSISFDYPDYRLDTDASWVRLRDDGQLITLAYKKRLGVTGDAGNDTGMEEVEFVVDSFEKTAEFLLKIGLVEKFSQEKRRICWKKGNVEFDIDTWPRIPTYLEIEAPTDAELERAIEELSLDKNDAKRCSATQVYKKHGINDKDYQRMAFDSFIPRTPRV